MKGERLNYFQVRDQKTVAQNQGESVCVVFGYPLFLDKRVLQDASKCQ